MALPIQLAELHYYGLQQNNVYCMTKIEHPDGKNKLLVSSLSGKISCLSFKNDSKLEAKTDDIQFHYVPHDAEIVSIDAYSRRHCGLVVGITFVKRDTNSCFLNVYSEGENSEEWDLTRIAQSCRHYELKFIPYRLHHSKLEGKDETVFLLSGSDKNMHMFRENSDNFFQQMSQNQVFEFFPEFQNLFSVPLWWDSTLSNNKRLTVIGFQDASITLSIVNLCTKEIHKFERNHESPITCVRIFETSKLVQCPQFVKEVLGEDEFDDPIPKKIEEQNDHLHIVASSALQGAVVYRSILSKNLENALTLPESDKFDCVLTLLAVDVDFDGENEIIIGTYGQQVLIYKFTNNDQYQVTWRRSFADPVLGIQALDLTFDGMLELAVLTLKGVSIMQHQLGEVTRLVASRLKALFQYNEDKDAFEELQEENLEAKDGNYE